MAEPKTPRVSALRAAEMDAQEAWATAGQEQALAEFLAQSVLDADGTAEHVARRILKRETAADRVVASNTRMDVDGRLSMGGWVARLHGLAFLDLLRRPGGGRWNNMSMNLEAEGVKISVVIQREDGETLAQQRDAARARVAELEAELAALRTEVPRG